jgi:UPF0755 protein
MTETLLQEYEPRPAPRPRPRRRRGPMILLSVLLAILLIAGVGAVWITRQLRPPGARGAAVTITIPTGTSTSTITELLQRQGVITNARLFRLYLQLVGGGPFQAGQYVFHRHDHMSRAADVLRVGPIIVTRRLTIPEGFTLAQIAERVGHLPNRSAARFLEVARSGVVRSQLVAAGFTNLEGLLFPDTYSIEPNEDETRILTRMVSLFDQQVLGLGYQDAPRRVGVSPYQAAIVASLVESEAKVPEDRAPIARVIYNRLARGMPLQIDATVQYALGGHRTRVLNRDLEVSSPFNTYRIKGLPPGPISSPGRPSLAAALDPTPGPWIYYVLADANGKHAFTDSSAEFEKLKAAAHAKSLL